MIFRQYALFPWLSVRKNVEFGLKLTDLPAAERKLRHHEQVTPRRLCCPL